MDPVQEYLAKMKRSPRIGDRKDGAQGLVDYLNSNTDDICLRLDLNSVNPEKKNSEKMTWTKLFTEVIEFFSKETEKAQITHMNQLFFFSFVDKVFQKAICNGPLLQWNKVFDFIVSNLHKERIANLYGPSLINMLDKFLAIELYATVIDANSWVDLILNLLRCHKRYSISISSLLRCLNTCIFYGSLHSKVIRVLRSEVVTFYMKLVQNEQSAVRQNTAAFLEGVTILCNQNALEFRGILCKLGESVTPHILQAQSFSEVEVISLVDYLLVQIRLHAPCDVGPNSAAFYADDPAKWKDILEQIYSYCIDTIEDVANKRATFKSKDTNIYGGLLTLAAKSTKQITVISNIENENSEEEVEVRAKKKMRYKSFNTIISDLCIKSVSEGHLVWMEYFTAVLELFPELVSSRTDLSNLIHLGNKLFNTTLGLRKEYYVYFVSLLKAEEYLVRQGTIADMTDTWNTVWELTIKSLPVSEAQPEAVNLLRHILKVVRPKYTVNLLTLYLNGSMPLQAGSVHLLAEYLTLCSLPVQMSASAVTSTSSAIVDEEIAVASCPRRALIKWLMNFVKGRIFGVERLIATIMCSLIVKQSHALIQGELEPTTNFSSYNTYMEFETTILKSCFVKPKEKHGTESKRLPNSSMTRFIFEPRIAERLADALEVDFNESQEKLNLTSDAMRLFNSFVAKVNVYLNILNVLEKILVGDVGGSQHGGFKTTMEKIFDAAMLKFNSFTADCFASSQFAHSPAQIKLLIKSARTLISNKHFCDKVSTMLSHRINQQVQELFKKVFRCNLAKYIERSINNPHEAVMFADESRSDRLRDTQLTHASELELITRNDRSCEEASKEALHALIDYGLICHHRLEIFTEIMKDLDCERFSTSNQFLFDACADLISELTKVVSSPGLFDLIGTMIGLLQKCCRSFYQLPVCAERLWKVFKEMTSIVASVDNMNRNHFMILVGTCSNLLKTGRGATIPAYKKAFDTLSEMAKCDSGLAWTEFTPFKASPVWVLDGLHEFLDNESQVVRLLAADTICFMYEQANPFDYSGTCNGMEYSQELPAADTTAKDVYQEKRKVFLDTLFHKLIKTFDVDSGLSPEANKEESINRTSLVLSCLTRLIFAFPYLQKQSVFYLFVTVKLKAIDMKLAQRALEYSSPMSTKTMCCYLSHVLKKGLKQKELQYSVEDLPYLFFGCNSLNDLLSKFRHEVCVEYFEQDKLGDLERYSKGLNSPIQDLIKDCYGLIMARLTPGLAIHKYKMQSRGMNLGAFNETHKRLITALGGKDATETLMVTCLGDVVLNLISLTFEPTIPVQWDCPKVKLAEPVPPHYPESTIETCLEFLKTASPRSDISVIGYLATTSPQSVYKILLALAVRIHDAHDESERFWRLHQFSFFVTNSLLNEPPEIFSHMKEYVCTFVFNSYFRLLKIEIEDEVSRLRFQKAVILLISKLVERITEEYTDEMMVFFNSVIRGIVSAIVKSPTLMECAKGLLDFLLKLHVDTFVKCIEALDPFPSHITQFYEYNVIQQTKKYGNRRNDWPLQKEFERYLDESDNLRNCTKERLHFLRELLSQRKRDLDRMVKNLENKRFSDDCSKDSLHCIIQMLIEITLSNKDEDVIMEACRCLGEIGPIDLSVLVLPVYKNKGRIHSQGDAIPEIIRIISNYITSDDIRLVTVSGKVLRALCEFDEFDNVIRGNFGRERLSKVLTPFQTCTMKKSVEKVDVNLLETKLGLNEMNEGITYRDWLVQLTAGFIESFKSNSSFTTNLLPLCELRVDFCENILPLVVIMCLQGGKSNPIVKRIMAAYFRNFFSKFVANLNSAMESTRSFTPSSSGTPTSCIYMNKLALRSLLRVIQFLRRHPLPQELKGNVKLTPWDSNFWLEVNYLDVARAAQYCGAYLTSILYVEIAATEMDISGSPQYLDDIADDDGKDQYFSQGASMYPRNRIEASRIEKLLLKAYTSIGESDAAYGCGSARFADVQSSMHHLEQTMEWHKLMLLANGSADNSDSCQEHQVALSLKQLGLYNTLWHFLKGVEGSSSGLPEDLCQIQYECGWRLTKWNLNSDKPGYIKEMFDTGSAGHSTFQMCIYDGIQAGLAQDLQTHKKAIKSAYAGVHIDLRHATLESSENIYGYLSRLQMVRTIENFFEKESTSTANNLDIDNFTLKWKLQDRVPASDFKYTEPILFLRNVLLRAYDEINVRVNLESHINESLLDLIAKAREAGRLDFAESCASTMASLCSKPSKCRKDFEFEVAMNHWASGKEDIASSIMNKLIRKSSAEDDIYPTLLIVYGEWLSKTHSERPSVILEKYLQRSCSIYDKRAGAPLHEISKAHLTLAKYADNQYQNVSKYIGSELFTQKLDHIKRAKQQMEQVKTTGDNEVRKSAIILQKHTNNDSEEIAYIYNEKKKFVMLALRHYLKGLKASSEQDLLIFRAVSLWLENREDDEDAVVEETTRIFREETMPTYKYIVVLHQLSARLSNTASSTNELLRDILAKCAVEHPYHALPVLLTQASLHKDENLPKKSASVQLAGRVQAAAVIVDKLKGHKQLKTLVQRMETLWLALINLANMNDGGRNLDGVKKNVPKEVSKYLTNLEMVSVPTTTIPVLPSGNYTESVVGIAQFGNTFGLVGGINSPKKLTCRGSNGILYNLLLKGQDDLRQDAVMQQVFGVMNKLLQVQPKTWARRLHIRTYKVVPLSQRTGVIEWVENTQTLGDYLVGSPSQPGAHERYRPTDYKPTDCRRLMTEARNCGDFERKCATYMTICEHFRPVFRHFFFENFKEAGAFFEKRLAYTRSVATTSIVGYILGLGDRHVLNILIDKTTAEFIHIDLGVAFEQGRILPTPETVPFRLTRDVIDGMGISGAEGVFKRSCEMTMEVLRNNSEIILTVLQVLLYDPLYMWALTTDRVAKVQPSSESNKGGRKSKSNIEPPEDSVKERNNSAARVLLRLKQKLMGIEEEGGASGAISSGSSLSVDGHVSLLIQRAMDPEKLCRLFPGWQPYL